MIAQELLCGALVGGVAGVRIGEGQPEGPLVVAAAPGEGDEFAGIAEGAEALAVKIVGEAEFGGGCEGRKGTVDVRLAEVANDDVKPVGVYIAGVDGAGNLADVLQGEVGLRQAAARAAVG